MSVGGLSVPGEPLPDEEVFGTSGRPSAVGSWAINLRNAALERAAEIDDYHELSFVTRHNAVGTWTIQVHRDAIYADDLLAPGAGLIIVKGDRTILSGPAILRTIERRGEDHTVTVSGVDDNVWLTRRLVSPQPATSVPPYSSSAYDVRTGVCSTILREYVNVNAGPGALLARRVPGLVLGTNPGAGSSVTGRGRWQPLLELLTELALAGGGLRINTLQVDDELQFQVTTPQDLSSAVRFSDDLGNLGDYELEIADPDANFIYCGGGGEGTARTIRQGSDSASIARWGRFERFRDRRDTTDATELAQTINEELDEAAAEQHTLEYTPLELPNLAPLDDYDLGDAVTAVIEGVTVTELIREIEFDFSAKSDAVDITPHITPPGRRKVLDTWDQLRELHRRMLNLERR